MTRGPTLPAHRLPHLPTPLDAFNAVSAGEAHTLLLHCLNSPRWSRRVADHRPYPDLDALLAAADEAAYDLSPRDLAEALAAEALPELPANTYSAAHMALSAAHAAYESRFGHAFVIYLGDTHPEESLAHTLEAIRSRLTNDPEEERVISADQLRRVARNRLVTRLRGAGNRATSHNSHAPGRKPQIHPGCRIPSPSGATLITLGRPPVKRSPAHGYDAGGRWTVPGRARPTVKPARP